MIPGSYNNNMQLVQTEDHVMILNEMVHTARIIPYADDFDIKQGKWEGNSIARWEDDTLIIETKGWYHTYNLRGMSNEAHVVERFSRADDNTLEYDFTVTDPCRGMSPGQHGFPCALHQIRYSNMPATRVITA